MIDEEFIVPLVPTESFVVNYSIEAFQVQAESLAAPVFVVTPD